MKNSIIKPHKNTRLSILTAAIGFPLFMMLFLPAQANSDWEVFLFYLLTEKLKLSVGLNGPLPFYTVVVSAYLGMVIFVLSFWRLYWRAKTVSLGVEFQQACYRHLDGSILNSKYNRWIRHYPLLLKLYVLLFVLLLILFCFAMGVWHLFDPNMSFQRGSRGGLIAWGYQNKIGIIIWESAFHIFTVAAICFVILSGLYLFNLIRGLGWGKPPVEKSMRFRKKLSQPALQYSTRTKNQKKRLKQKGRLK